MEKNEILHLSRSLGRKHELVQRWVNREQEGTELCMKNRSFTQKMRVKGRNKSYHAGCGYTCNYDYGEKTLLCPSIVNSNFMFNVLKKCLGVMIFVHQQTI